MSDTTTTPSPEDVYASVLEQHLASLIEARRGLGLAPLATIPATGLVPDVVDGQLIESAWGNAIRDRAVQRFDTYAALTAGWPNAANGSRAVTLDTFRAYTKRGAGGTGWQPDLAFGRNAIAFNATGDATQAHDLGRVPVAGFCSPGAAGNFSMMVVGLSATTLTLKAYTANTGTAYQGSPQVNWLVL